MRTAQVLAKQPQKTKQKLKELKIGCIGVADLDLAITTFSREGCIVFFSVRTEKYLIPSDVFPNSPDSPSPPDINPGNQPYPFMAGDSPTLYCNYPATTDPGNPTATLTLEGQTGSAGQGEVSVTLTQLTSADNGRTVVCTASNAFTVHNNTAVTQRLQLQVYCEYSFAFI